MSGSTRDDDSDHVPAQRFGGEPEFEADVKCAFTTTSPVLITAPADVAAALASRIHRHSVNRTATFLTLDCARTSAAEQLQMAFDTAAPGGTLFLRDVDRLSPALQSHLSGRIIPLGVRVMAATSSSLLRAVNDGGFDERLFYRLNLIHLVAPTPGGRRGAA